MYGNSLHTATYLARNIPCNWLLYSCLPVSLPHKKNRSHPVHRVLIYCDFTFGHCRNSGGESRAQAWLLSPRHEAREFVGQRRHREAGGLWLGARDPGVGGAQLGRFVAWELLGNYGYHELVKASFLAARMIG